MPRYFFPILSDKGPKTSNPNKPANQGSAEKYPDFKMDVPLTMTAIMKPLINRPRREGLNLNSARIKGAAIAKLTRSMKTHNSIRKIQATINHRNLPFLAVIKLNNTLLEFTY